MFQNNPSEGSPGLREVAEHRSRGRCHKGLIMPFTAAEIAKHLGGEVIGDSALVLKGFAPADRAQAGDLTFAEERNYFPRAEQSAASAVIVDGPFVSNRKVLIRVPSARMAFAKVLPLFFPEPKFSAGHASLRGGPGRGAGGSFGPYRTLLRIGRGRADWSAQCFTRRRFRRARTAFWARR